MGSQKIAQLKSLNEERSELLKCIADILYLKHKKIPYPKVEIPDYFNIQTSETTLTINATKGGIDQFLQEYDSLKKPPEMIDLRPFKDPNRIWGSRRIVPAEKRFPEDISPYRAISSWRADAIVDSLKINFIEKLNKEVIFYVTGPYPEGYYKKIDESDFNSVSIKIWWDYFDHDFSVRVGDSISEKFKWIFGPLLKIVKESTKRYSLSELRYFLSKYGSVKELSDYYLSSALDVIESVDPDVFSKVYHPELTVNQKGWHQFLYSLKVLRDKKDWFFVTHLYEKKGKRFPFRLTSTLNKEENPFVFKAIEFVRPELEEVPCIRIKGFHIAGNCHGLLIVAQWLKNFASSAEKEKFILNQWGWIPYLSIKPGCIEPEQWLLLEKFEEELDEPFFSAERNHKDCLLMRGNLDGFLKVSRHLEKYAFTDTGNQYCYVYPSDIVDKPFVSKACNYFNYRFKECKFWLINSFYIDGGFNFSQKYNPASQYAKTREDHEDRNGFQEELDGHITHVVECSDEKFFEHYLDRKNNFLKERIIKSDDCK